MRRYLQIASALAVAVAAFMLYRFPPEQYAFYPACPFHALTGWQCPGCGSTRALAALLHGEPMRAFGLNPLLPLLPLIAYLSWRWGRSAKSQASVGVLLGALLVTCTLLRNLLHF